MRPPVLLLFLIIFFGTRTLAQSKPFLYGFQEIPQALLENPGGEMNFDKHIGIPFLSGLYVNAGVSNSLISELFENDGVDILDKFQGILSELDSRDFLSVNEQLEIVNIGYKLKNDRDYLSFGFYQELDLISQYPNDAAILFYRGNTDGSGNIDLNTSHNINDVSLKGELTGVFHAGISRKINSELSIGARVKLYSGAFNIQSFNNKGSISTRLDQNDNYQHLLNNVDVTFRSSGIIGYSGKSFVAEAFKNILFGGNLGLGFDVGFTYHLKENIAVLGSVLDLGFITYSNRVTTYKVNGDIEINDIGFLNPPVNGTLDFWDNISEDINTQIPKDTLNSTYVSFRSPKLNAAIQYGFGKNARKQRCTAYPAVNERLATNYQNEAGIQLYSIFRPSKPQLAATLYYSRSVSNFIKAKITYTVDSYSLSNIGLGFSTHLGKFNFYANADNLLNYKNIYSSKKLSILMGMNLIFDK